MNAPLPRFQQWVNQGFAPPFLKQNLVTSDSIQGELLGALQLYAEVKESGEALLARHGHTNLTHAYLRLRAHLRQAITFYESANSLHHRASPLIYYYAFLNLAKAIIFVRDPNFIEAKPSHGLSVANSDQSLQNHSTKTTSGVFSLLYKNIIGIPVQTGTTFQIADLFGYVSDITHEYLLFQIGKLNSCRCKLAIAKGHNTPKVRAILAIHCLVAHTLYENLNMPGFVEITINSLSAKEMFNISIPEIGFFRFFQSEQDFDVGTKTWNTKDVCDYIWQKLGKNLLNNPLKGDVLFSFNACTGVPAKVHMNEMFASYIITFHLGSLVRYQPEILEGMLIKKDAWLLERFIKSAPVTLLRHMRNILDDGFLAYENH